ncbi:hypothetical protein BDQ17DRAFT_1367912, partial [Cyathus striatus]
LPALQPTNPSNPIPQLTQTDISGAEVTKPKINMMTIRVRGKDWSTEDFSALREKFQAAFEQIPAEVTPTIEEVTTFPTRFSETPDVLVLCFAPTVFASEYVSRHMKDVLPAVREVVGDETASILVRKPLRAIVARNIDKITSIAVLAQTIAKDIMKHNPGWDSYNKVEIVTFVNFSDPESFKRVAIKVTVPDTVSWRDTLEGGIVLFGIRKRVNRFIKDHVPNVQQRVASESSE